MSGNDTLTRLNEWRSSLYRGDPNEIDRFLALIDDTLPSGWKRDAQEERRHSLTMRCYMFDQPCDALIGVLLRRTAVPTRVRGDIVRVYRNPPGPTERIGALIAELADKCVLPAAITVGIQHTRPGFGVRSVVTPTVEFLFCQLADVADGIWPLPATTREIWDDLISISLAEQVAIDRAELILWSMDSGWPQPAAVQLADKFFADAQWLAKRMAVASQ